ncbi:MAG TPA: sialidase family protein [Bryobacteraceae bacterium]|nr:sialidase family protein [Bryobacteraceae bacterium]
MRLTALLTIAVLCPAQEAGRNYRVGPNMRISAAQPSVRHYEAYAGADPNDARHLIACALVVRAQDRIDNVFYMSADRGKTWSHTLTVDHAVDPSCAIGSHGVAFAGNIHDQLFPDGKTDSVLTVYRSADGGRTWQPSAVAAESRGIDRAYVTPDSYAHGYRATRQPPAVILFYPSRDQGRSFDRVLVSGAAVFSKPWFFPGNGVVDDDGNFFALIAELDDTKRNMSYRTDAASAPSADAVLNIYVSRDAGQTLKPAGRIPGVCYDWRVPQLSLPVLAVDRSRGPFRGRLYAVWPDARFDRRTEILMSFSSDRGRTWSAPRAVSEDRQDDAANRHANQFMPAVAVNRDGVVGIAWYDRHDHADNLGYWVRFAASPDGGESWLPSTRVSSSPHMDSADTRKNSGDTAGLAADAGGRFHPVWIDNRTGTPQMWTATVRVRGKVRRRQRQ